MSLESALRAIATDIKNIDTKLKSQSDGGKPPNEILDSILSLRPTTKIFEDNPFGVDIYVVDNIEETYTLGVELLYDENFTNIYIRSDLIYHKYYKEDVKYGFSRSLFSKDGFKYALANIQIEDFSHFNNIEEQGQEIFDKLEYIYQYFNPIADNNVKGGSNLTNLCLYGFTIEMFDVIMKKDRKRLVNPKMTNLFIQFRSPLNRWINKKSIFEYDLDRMLSGCKVTFVDFFKNNSGFFLERVENIFEHKNSESKLPQGLIDIVFLERMFDSRLKENLNIFEFNNYSGTCNLNIGLSDTDGGSYSGLLLRAGYSNLNLFNSINRTANLTSNIVFEGSPSEQNNVFTFSTIAKAKVNVTHKKGYNVVVVENVEDNGSDISINYDIYPEKVISYLKGLSNRPFNPGNEEVFFRRNNYQIGIDFKNTIFPIIRFPGTRYEETMYDYRDLAKLSREFKLICKNVTFTNNFIINSSMVDSEYSSKKMQLSLIGCDLKQSNRFEVEPVASGSYLGLTDCNLRNVNEFRINVSKSDIENIVINKKAWENSKPNINLGTIGFIDF